MQGCSATCLRSVSTCAEDYSTAYSLPLRRNDLEKKPRNESRIIPNDFSARGNEACIIHHLRPRASAPVRPTVLPIDILGKVVPFFLVVPLLAHY
jgi:hypothetical protein